MSEGAQSRHDEALTGKIVVLLGGTSGIDHMVFTAGDSLVLGPIDQLDLAVARQAFEVRIFGAMAAAK